MLRSIATICSNGQVDIGNVKVPKMKVRQRLVVGAVAGLSLVGATTLVAAPADAASNYGSCGSGWPTQPRLRVPIKYTLDSAPDQLVGYLDWYVKSERHRQSSVCVITRPLAKYASKNHIMRASLKFYKDKQPLEDERSAKSYVGPVKATIIGKYWISGLIKIGSHVYSGIKWNLYT
jgi:hypothetical protein